MMDKATYEGIKEATNKRPFVVTRACYAGTQKVFNQFGLDG